MNADLYDVYLFTGCTQSPDVSALAGDAPTLADPALLIRMMEKHPGYLLLNLSETLAHTLLNQLRIFQAGGYVVSISYRTPHVSDQEARTIGARALTQKIAEQLTKTPDLTFGPPFYSAMHSTPWYWTFGSVCKEWQDEGYIPGILFVSVDKKDGHVLESDEFDRMAEAGR